MTSFQKMTSFQIITCVALALIGIISVSVVSYVFAASGKTSEAQDVSASLAGEPLPVETFVLGQIPAPPQLDRYRGLVVPSKESDLGFRRAGRIVEIHVAEGDKVRRGDVLATLDSSDVRSQLLTTQSQVQEAEALLAELIAGPRKQAIDAARSELERLDAVAALSRVTAARQDNLLRSNASSIQQYDEARYSVQQNEAARESAAQRLSELVEGTRAEQIAAQQARVEVLRSQLTTLQVDLDDTRIVSPFDGIISRRLVDEGTITNPQALVLRLIQCDPLEARFGVAPIDAQMLSSGAKVSVTVGEQAVEAVVARIEPELDLASRTQAVYVTLLGGCNAAVVPGQTASLAILRASEDAMWVPMGALSRAARGLWSVFAMVDVESGVGTIERREVQVVETDTEVASIVGSMVKPGDRLVAGGIHRITPGMRVSILQEMP